MFPKMRNILGVRQVLLTGVITVEALKMVDLVLVLVVAVVAGAEAKVRQAPALGVVLHPLRARDEACFVRVEESEDVAQGVDLVLLCGRGGGGGGGSVGIRGGVEAVEVPDLASVPVAVGIEVVEVEEGERIEVGDVVFFLGEGQRRCRKVFGNGRGKGCWRRMREGKRASSPAMCTVAQSGAGSRSLALGW